MASALGVKFKDEQDQEFIPTGGTLSQIYKIDMNNIYSKIKDVEFISMCDVDNSLCGKLGASAVFAPQKGADEDMVKLLDEGLAHLAKIIKRDLHIEVKDIKGAGAAGGLGAGSIAFLQSKLTKGIDVILDTIKFDKLVSKADIVFTGEGKFDSQSLHGKVVMGVANRSQKYKTPVIVVTGAIGENIQEAYNKGITAIFSINKEPMEFSKSALKSKENMILTMENILRLLKYEVANMQSVLMEKNEHLGIITLNRPKSLNAMNADLVEEFHRALDIFVEDEDIHVIILTGAGRAFCAGGDLGYLESLNDDKKRKAFIERVGEMTLKLRNCAKPVIGMINGVTAGAGVNLMLACDIVCSSEDAKFIQSFVNVGLVPDCGGMYLLKETVGLQKAKELMFTADVISAQEAEKLKW